MIGNADREYNHHRQKDEDKVTKLQRNKTLNTRRRTQLNHILPNLRKKQSLNEKVQEEYQ